MLKLNFSGRTLRNLSQMLDLPIGDRYDLLGFSLDLQTSTITDNLADTSWMALVEKLIPALLFHYSQGKKTALAGKLVKFRELGGYPYERAFNERAVKPVAQAFSHQPEDFPEAAKLVGGRPLHIGDYSAEITPLKGIPLTYILWVAAEEFPVAANVLYDQSAGSYLPPEDLAILGELTTSRLLKAEEILARRRSTDARAEDGYSL